MAQAVSPSAKLEADALMVSLRMAERHHRWALMAELLTYIGEAGGRVAYLSPGNYALALPTPNPKDPI